MPRTANKETPRRRTGPRALPLMLTPSQVAAALCVTPKTITQDWIPKGEFEGYMRLPGGEYRIPLSGFIKFCDNHHVDIIS